jgi:hypothetical protein
MRPGAAGQESPVGPYGNCQIFGTFAATTFRVALIASSFAISVFTDAASADVPRTFANAFVTASHCALAVLTRACKVRIAAFMCTVDTFVAGRFLVFFFSSEFASDIVIWIKKSV